jgi:hypothetical protein
VLRIDAATQPLSERIAVGRFIGDIGVEGGRV